MSPTTDWAERFWRRTDPAISGDRPVAFGGSLTAPALLSAYRNGLLPMPAESAEDAEVNALLYRDDVLAGEISVVGSGGFDLAWWWPDPRPVLTAATVRLGHGLTKTLRSRRYWHTTVDQAFGDVLAGCRADREPRWLTDELVEVLTELHAHGWYHSVETWADADLVGGAAGIGVGGVFSCDTMFHRQSGASQIALADLAVRLADTSAGLLDLQWDHPHVRRIGARFVPRSDYLRLAAAGTPVVVPGEARTVAELLDRLRGRPAGTLNAKGGTPWAA